MIKRYSLAIRRDAVPADELLAALDASRATVLAAMQAAGESPRPSRATSATAARRRTTRKPS